MSKLIPLIGFVISLVYCSAVQSSSNYSSGYDHNQASFPLVGAHLMIECETCHRYGLFNGTQSQCNSCHNGSVAFGKPLHHLPTTLQCDKCHNEIIFTGVKFNHISISVGCAACHNNIIRIGKPPNHINTLNMCGNCHTSTDRFKPVLRVNHYSVIGTCRGCHLQKMYRSSTHAPTNDECSVCHKTVTWRI